MYEQTGRFYALFGPHAAVTAEEERFLAFWTAGHRKVLDFGSGLCGPALTLSRLGLEVLAFEPSPLIATLAMDRLGRGDEHAQAITLVEGHTDTFHEPFAADLILMRSVLMLLDSAQRDAAFEAVRRHAAPGARLVADVRTASLPWADQGTLADSVQLGHTRYLRRTHYTRRSDGATGVHWAIESERFGRSVEIAQEDFLVWADTVEGFQLLLSSKGFQAERLFGAYDLDRAYRDGDAMIVGVGRKTH